MSEQVPGDKEEPKEISTEEMVRELARYYGHAGLNRLRGKLHILRPFLEELLEEEDSPWFARNPSTADAKLGSLFRDLAPLVRKMVQYRRDGKNELTEELLNALARKDYLLPGETSLSNKTMPLTVFLLEPEKTLAIVRWFTRLTWEPDHLNRLVFGKSYLEHGRTSDQAISLEAVKLLEMFPSIKEYAAKLAADETGRYGWGNSIRPDSTFFNCWPVRFAYQQEVIEPNLEFFNRLPKNEWNDWKWFGLPISRERIRDFKLEAGIAFTTRGLGAASYLHKKAGIDEPDSQYQSNHLLFLYAGPPDELLQLLPRAEQHRLSTWTFRIPANHYNREKGLLGFDCVGLHEEAEHEEIRRRWPMFASHGMSHGLGATFISGLCSPKVWNYGELHAHYDWKRWPYDSSEFRLLFGNH